MCIRDSRTAIAFFAVICIVGCDVPPEPVFTEATTAGEPIGEPGKQSNSFSVVEGDLLVSYERIEFKSKATQETASAKCDATKVEFYPNYVLIYNETRVRMLMVADLKVFDIEKR